MGRVHSSFLCLPIVVPQLLRFLSLPPATCSIFSLPAFVFGSLLLYLFLQGHYFHAVFVSLVFLTQLVVWLIVSTSNAETMERVHEYGAEPFK